MEVMIQPTLCGVVVKITLLHVILMFNIVVNNKRVIIHQGPRIVTNVVSTLFAIITIVSERIVQFLFLRLNWKH